MKENTDMVEKLNNHRLPINESYWAEMEDRLQQKRKKTAVPWVWFTGTGIAASLALLLAVQIFDADDSIMVTQIAQTFTDKEISEQASSFIFNEIEETTNDQLAANNTTMKKNQQTNGQRKLKSAFSKNVSTQKTQIEQIHADNLTNEQHLNSRESALSASSAFNENEETADNISNAEPDMISKKPKELSLEDYERLLLAENEQIFQKEKKKNKNSWEIATAFSSSASNSSTGDFAIFEDNYKRDYYAGIKDKEGEIIPPSFNPENPTISDDRNNSWLNTDSNSDSNSSGNMANNDKNSVMPPTNPDLDNNHPSIDDIHGQFSEVIHLPPLSVGLMVRKNLNKHLAVETGLTYTFLQSKFKDNSEWVQREATQKLHYLGIPLNAVVYLQNKPKWNVYFSLGGMMEKGIMADYVQHSTYNYPYLHENPPTYTVSLQDDIEGLQWSLNSSFGINYKIYRGIGIYFEPRIIYYFKNNQPASARTETPLQVGLNAGLRFEF